MNTGERLERRRLYQGAESVDGCRLCLAAYHNKRHAVG